MSVDRRSGGQAAVELALIAPVMVLLIMMILQAAFLGLAKYEVHMEARKIALEGAMLPELLNEPPASFMDQVVYGELDPEDYFRWSTDYSGSGERVYHDGKFLVEIRYHPLLSPEERAALEEIEVEGGPLESGLVSMGALDFGYEEIKASVEVYPLPMLAWLHPTAYVVSSGVIRGLSEGVER